MSTLSDIVGAVVGSANPVSGTANAATGLINGVKGLLGFFHVDDTVKAQITEKLTEENLDVEKLQMASDLALAKGQMAINLAEAQKGGLFNDWRDAVGWTCAIALFWNYVGQPFGVDILLACHRAIDITLIPKLDMTSLFTLLGTMLGTGASQFHLSGGDSR